MVQKTLEENHNEESESKVIGIEILLKDKPKTSVYYGLDGVVRVQSKSPEVDVEELLEELVHLI